ncbi:MAG: hypothetical protein AAGA93_00720 [Actinomycetota bacterium]
MADNPFSPDPATATDLERVRTTTQDLDQLLGLYVVPPGLAVVLVGAANALPSGRWNPLLVVAAVVVGVASWLVVCRHYRRTVGTVVRRTTRSELTDLLPVAVLLLGGALADAAIDAPVSLTLVALAAAFGLGLVRSGGHRLWFAVTLLVASVAVGPLWWGPSTTGGLAAMVMGASLVAAGVATHARLDDALAPVGASRA